MFNFHANAITGLSLISSFVAPVSRENIQMKSMALAGHYDLQLKCGFYFSLDFPGKLKFPTSEEDLDVDVVLQGLDNLKYRIRSEIQALLKDVELIEASRNQAQREAKMKEMNTPSAFGTVAELASKLGVTKAEVRRLKQTPGALEAALQKLHEH